MKRRNQTQKVRQLNYQLLNKNRRELNLSKLPQTYQIQTGHLKKNEVSTVKVKTSSTSTKEKTKSSKLSRQSKTSQTKKTIIKQESDDRNRTV